jgi:hypothetical protein
VSLWLALLSCGADEGTDQAQVVVPAPVIQSDYRGVFFASPTTSDGPGGLFRYDFAKGQVARIRAVDWYDPILEILDNQLVIIERKQGQERIYTYELDPQANSQNQGSTEFAEHALESISPGDPWDLIAFSRDSLMFVNPLLGSIQKRRMNGALIDELTAAEIGLEHFRPVVAQQLTKGREYLIASQGLSNSEVPVINGKQTLIRVEWDSEGAYQEARALPSLSLSVPQALSSVAGTSVRIFGLCPDQLGGCQAGISTVDMQSMTETSFAGMTTGYSQFGGVVSGGSKFFSQVNNAAGNTVLASWDFAGRQGDDFFTFETSEITNIHFDAGSKMLFFGESRGGGGEGSLVIASSETGAVEEKVELDSIPYAFVAF